MMDRPDAFENWIFHSWEASPGGLGLFRIIASLYTLFFLIPGGGVTHYEFLAGLPDQFYLPPPGPMSLLDGFPPVLFFQGMLLLLFITLMMLTIGYQTKWVSFLSGGIILVLQGFLFSIGKVNHELLIGILPILMAFTNWGAAYSVDSLRQAVPAKTESWPLTLLALLIGFMMFTAGLPKILGGWLDPSTQAVQGHLFNQYFMRGRVALLAGWFVNLDSPVFWEILDWATVLFEIGFLAAVWKPAWFRFFLLIAVFFHFSTMLVLNIPFIPNLVMYAAFLNWTRADQKLQEWVGTGSVETDGKYAFALTSGVIITGILLFGLIKVIHVRNPVFTDTDLGLYEVILVGSAVLIATGITLTKFWKKFVVNRL